MNNLFLALHDQFIEKGFFPTEIEALTKDIFMYFQNTHEHSLLKLNEELENLGWGLFLLDQKSFDKIVMQIEQFTTHNRECSFYINIEDINKHMDYSINNI